MLNKMQMPSLVLLVKIKKIQHNRTAIARGESLRPYRSISDDYSETDKEIMMTWLKGKGNDLIKIGLTYS